jgi:hypothetical protein
MVWATHLQAQLDTRRKPALLQMHTIKSCMQIAQ